MTIESMSAADVWMARNVRHFRRLLYAAIAVFVVTEVTAFFDVVPHLRPLSLQDITGNILFAIGFGCPLVLHLSSLPRWREVAATMLVGVVLAFAVWLAHQWSGLPDDYKPAEVVVAEAVTGLGLASLGAMSLAAWRNSGASRVRVLAFLLPASVAMVITLEAGIFLYLIKGFCPSGRDPSAYAIDAGFGTQWSFTIGRLFAEWPVLNYMCYAIYVAPPPALVFVYAMQTRAVRPPPVDAATALLAVFVTGYSFYFLFPVYGPQAAFRGAFADTLPPLEGLVGTRMTVLGADAWPNGMPSLHISSVVLAAWQARPYGWRARVTAAIFLFGTFLATLGMGEHYLIDLVVAMPLCLAVYAACMPARPEYCRQRRDALFAGVALLAFWYALLFLAVEQLAHSVGLTVGVSLATTAAVLWLERRMYRATESVAVHSADSSVPHAANSPALVAPGPPGHFLIGNVMAFRRDVLQLLLDSRREYGDVVRYRLGGMVIHLVSHPDHIKQVLVTHQHQYSKATRSSSKIAGITGGGLLTSSGDAWLRRRRLMQPAFNAQALLTYIDVITAATDRMLESWRDSEKTGRPIDLASEMTRLTCTIIARVMLGADMSGDLEDIERSSTVVMAHTWRRLQRIVDAPLWLPTPGNKRFLAAKRRLDEIVRRLIADRRGGSDRNDLLAILLRATDDGHGTGMTDDELHNETITLLLAGHETTANALSWTFYLLGQHPHWYQETRDEVGGVLGQRQVAANDLPRLDLLTRVFQEAMRLYPPIWVMERQIIADDVIGGFHIPAGSSMEISPWVTHRHPEFWSQPDEFDPDRFTPEQVAARPQYAYLPFGAGQRMCIGSHLAMLEARVIMARVLQRYRLDLVPGTIVTPLPGITLRLRHGLPMTIHAADS